MKMHPIIRSTLLTVLLVASTASRSPADSPRVFPAGKIPDDHRLQALKDLNGYFPFEVPATKEAWQERREELKRRVRVATGLWPMPEKTPLKAVIHGRVDRDDFTVEKVYFESLPNHFVTGLLFRPKGKSGRLPGVLCPHGHGGRTQDYGEENMPQLIRDGAEKYEASGRYPKLARCAQLARMGCVAFIFDMLGYVDSPQISNQLAHGFAKQRPEFDSPQSWGFYSTQAELRMQSIMGLQTWNSIRALDFLCGLPDVDPGRIGVTGGSGGGTQTILLCAIDPRPVVAFPQGMVSTSMQGGCTCENCSLLRIGTGNVELAALFAPKPQGMTAANDWTKEMMSKGYPELRRLYSMLGAEGRVFCEPQLQFPHNYNYATRGLMHNLFNRHLGLGLAEPVVEPDFRPLTPAEWTVWDDKHPKPQGGDDYERELLGWMDEQSREQMAQLTPHDEKSLAEFREVVGGAFRTIVGRSLEEVGEIEREQVAKVDRGDYWQSSDILRTPRHGQSLPVVRLVPKKVDGNKRVVIWLDGDGKNALFDDRGRPQAAVLQLLQGGAAVLGADLLYQGEFLADGKPLDQQPVVANPREFAGYTFAYNHPLLASRAQDVLTLIAYAAGGELGAERIDLVGTNGAGPWAAAALAQAGAAIDSAVIDTGGFRFVNLKSYRDVNFLPGAVKYGDLPALLALSAPRRLAIAGESEIPALVAAACRASGRSDRVQRIEATTDAILKRLSD
jgi:dienelactone hydrolase